MSQCPRVEVVQAINQLSKCVTRGGTLTRKMPFVYILGGFIPMASVMVVIVVIMVMCIAGNVKS